MIVKDKLSEILADVERPARYIGEELNICRKNPEDVTTRFLFAFPDAYEVGMSHLGTTILYNLVNERKDAYAERVFAPFPDMQEAMKKAEIPLYSLETYTPASEFDIIGFNLSYEMCYTTVLAMLMLANMPLHSEKRDGLPLVIAGGTCTYDPEPLCDFIDLFVIGEGEEVINDLLDLYAGHKNKGFEKKAFLKAASKIEGVYVPSEVKVSYNADGTVSGFEGENLPIKKRYVDSLDAAYFPDKQIVPFMDIVHDRITLEIMRGCSRGCRFCQAGYVYRPVRERKRDTLFAQSEKLLSCTGYEEISLSSLSSGDYSEISDLAIGLLDKYESNGVGISLPSLRIDSFDSDYAKRMESVRKTNYTFAPEAGTQRLRDVINKNVTEEDLLRSVRYAFESGATGIKLYFMIGLPTETYEDLDGIADLAHKVIAVFKSVPKELKRGVLNLHISTSTFVPKPFTPFQWMAQESRESITEKQNYLKEKLKIKNVKYNWHDVDTSFLEAVFARGDRRLGKVLEYACEGGAMFDSWHDYFKPEAWEDAFKKAGIDPEFYANRERKQDEVLPYDHISCRVSKAYLIKELELSRIGKTTDDCRKGCNGCGLEGWCLK